MDKVMEEKDKTVCTPNQCAGCMACVDICPKGAILVRDDTKFMNAIIDPDKCIGCNACHSVCQQNFPATLHTPRQWLQGWAPENVRSTSSSGGFGQAVMKAMIQHEGAVAACKWDRGQLLFDLFEDESKVNDCIGSKYVKSNPAGIYKAIKQKLTEGKKVLFVGLPCQVSSVRNYVKDHENLYTVDLICHGAPSIKLLQKSMEEYGVKMPQIESIRFRHADKFAMETHPKRVVPQSVQDRYTIAFLHGISYTENCYFCRYAQVDRVGDLTIGDSWGTEMQEELSKGVSLILCQTDKGKQLLDWVDFQFFPVNTENSIQQNKQLQHPSAMPAERNQFFADLSAGCKFNQAVMKVYPKECIRQDFKALLAFTGLWKHK